MNMKYRSFVAFSFSLILIASCKFTTQEKKIIDLHKIYVDGWITYDSTKIMSIFEDDAALQPPGLTPIFGKRKMAEYWFPNDGSKITIQDFEFDPIHVEIRDTIAILTYDAVLDYVYQKDTMSISQVETSIGTAIYRKQFDDSWKVWRQFWTNTDMKRK